MTITSLSKTDLARMYKIDASTFKVWCMKAKIFTLEYYNSIRIFNPKEVESIVNHFGKPEIDID